jgi:hypothetical protein
VLTNYILLFFRQYNFCLKKVVGLTKGVGRRSV